MTSNRSMGESGSYVCNGRMRGADCPGVAINREALERFIRDVVAGSLDSPEVMELQAERLNQAAEGSASSELSELHEQADALGDSILILRAQINTAPASAMSALLNRIGEEEALKGQIEMRISEKTEGRPRAIPDISGAEFLELSETEQKSIIRAFLRKVVVYADDGKRGSVKGMFGSQGTNLSRIGFWYLGEADDQEPRRGAGTRSCPRTAATSAPSAKNPGRSATGTTCATT